MTSFNKRRKKNVHSTYVVPDRLDKGELARLVIQDDMLTNSMGGVLAEQSDPHSFQRVLDIGCGAGKWVIDAAQRYPAMSLVGVDINPYMVDYANGLAAAANVSDRVDFCVMDVLRKIDFPALSFDLVNLRLGISFLRTWDWPDLLLEMLRVTRSGGVIRITDEEIVHESTSFAHRQFSEMLLCAFFRSGHLFELTSTGLSAHLAPFLIRFGCEQVQVKKHGLEYRMGTPAGQAYYENTVRVFESGRPFLQKWGCIPNDYDAICQRILKDMQEPGFCSTWNFLTAWGIKP